MGLNDGLPAGATHLDGEELEGLLPSHLVNRSQLNEWEQQNIEAALLWLSRQRRRSLSLLRGRLVIQR